MGKPQNVQPTYNKSLMVLSTVFVLLGIACGIIGLISSFRLFPAINGVGSLLLGVFGLLFITLSKVVDKNARM